MEISISEQALEFLAACLLGGILGGVYDLFRIARLAFSNRWLITLVEDLLFWLLSAVVTFLFLLLFSEAQVRLYLLIGELLGFTVYYFSIGSLVMKLSKWLIGWIKRVLRLGYRLFISPFVRLFSFVFRGCGEKFKKVGKKIKKIKQNSKKYLQNEDSLLYNQNGMLDDTKNTKNWNK